MFPGRNGVAPSVGAGYSSNQSNGLMGVGWSLTGFDAIRCLSSNPTAILGESKTCGMSSLDMSINYSSTFKQSSTANVFYSYGGSKARITYHPSDEYWVMDVGNGTKIYFGGDETDNCTESGNDCETFHAILPEYSQNHGGSPLIFVGGYLIYKIVDSFGNYVKYYYTDNSDGNSSRYPDKIEYTRHTTADPTNWYTIKFEYETRNDWTKGPNVFKRRLTQVKTYGKSTSSSIGSLFNVKKFAYHTSPTSGRSRIYKINAENGDGSYVSKENSFYWSNGGTNTSNLLNAGTTASLMASGNDPLEITQDRPDYVKWVDLVGDFNGDGFKDLLYMEESTLFEINSPNDGDTSVSIYVYNGSSSGLGTTKDLTTNLTIENDTSSDPVVIDFQVVDLNGDGYDDIVYFGLKDNIPYTKTYFGSSSGLNTTPQSRTYASISTYNVKDIHYNNISYADITGDGFKDLIFWRDVVRTSYYIGSILDSVEYYNLEVFTIEADPTQASGFSSSGWVHHSNPGVEHIWSTEPDVKIGNALITDIDGDFISDFCYITTGRDTHGTTPEYWGAAVNCAKFDGTGYQLTQSGNAFITEYATGTNTDYVRRRFIFPFRTWGRII